MNEYQGREKRRGLCTREAAQQLEVERCPVSASAPAIRDGAIPIQLYLKGTYYTAKFTQEGFRKGIDYLNQAIALDPTYADAYSALAYNYINQDDWFIPPAHSAPKARAASLKALSLEEGDVGAHVALAIETDWYEWDWAGADREFRRALEIDPVDGDALGYYSWFLPSMGRGEEAVEHARLQTKTYPLSFGANGNLGSVWTCPVSVDSFQS